jgi:hypothetical protein
MDIKRASEALRNAHEAGDTEAATKIATAIRAFSESQQPETEYGLQDAIVSGMTFGLDDNVAALGSATGQAIRAGLDPDLDVDFGGTYDRALDDRRLARRQYMQQNPVIGTGAEIIGGVLTGGPVVKKAIQKGATTLGRIGRGALSGAGFGGLGGYGFSEDNPIEGTLQGLTLGGTIGGFVPGATQAVSSGLQRVIPRANVTTPAQKDLARALGGVAPRQAIKRMERLGPEATIADLTPGTQNLARDVRAMGVPGSTRADIVLRQRARSQPDRLADAVSRHLTNNNDAYVRGKQLVAARKANAQAAYKEANEAVPQYFSNDIADLIKVPAIKKEIRRVKQFPNFKDFPDNSSEVLDQVYKQIGGKARSPQGDFLDTGLANKLRDAMVTENPAYGGALQRFATDKGLEETLELGRKFHKDNPGRIKDLIDDMSGEEKTEYLTGVADAIIDKVKRGVRGRDRVSAVFGSPRQEEQLARLFPSRQAFQKFQSEVLRETRFTESKAKIIQQSSTADKQAGMKQIGMESVGDVAFDAITGNQAGIVRRGLQAVGDRMRQPRRGVAEDLAKVLFNRDQAANVKTLQSLAGRQSSDLLNRQLQDRLAAALISGGALSRSRQ